MTQKTSGKVMVVGAGIAGTQTSLDLANSGYKVLLVDKLTSIGGVMSQLDKTFPTNDCSMCILSPKLVDAARNRNIELITKTEVEEIKRDGKNFKVKLLRKARFVDMEKCKGCSDCADACPVTKPNPYEENLGTRKAIFRLLEQATPSAFNIDKLGLSPCRASCPLHVNAQGYLALISIGKYKEAFELEMEKNPFPATFGRICSHPCQDSCTRGQYDGSVRIRDLKRALVDFNEELEYKLPELKPDNGKKIGIIGGGPSGMMCAYELRKEGYQVEIFEELDKLGGMMYVGIPAFRLPREILFNEVSQIEKLGVKVHYNTKVGDTIQFDEILKKFDAVYIATGAHTSRSMGISGEEQGWGAVELLRKFSLGEDVELGKKAIVVGGGNAAIDAARSLRRKGVEIDIVYRRTKKEMPADEEEIDELEEEGIKIQYLTNPVKVNLDGDKIISVECIRNKLGESDSSGRRRPVPIEGSEFTMDIDMVVMAISQESDLKFTGDKLELWKKSAIIADEKTYQTSVEKVFAGGDVVTGPKTAIEAMGAGKSTAISIIRFLNGEDLKKDRELEGPYETEFDINFKNYPTVTPYEKQYRKPEERVEDFSEVSSGFNSADAIEEAKRCLHCADCSDCMECVRACEPEAIFHDMKDILEEVEVGAVVLEPGFDEFDPITLQNYGYKRFPNVVTSIEFERIMSASGPFDGHISRLSKDHSTPKKVAWIQCVGSRNSKIGKGYCSSVCCMYATKEAVIAMEHSPGLEATIFYIDIRSFGKDFDKYIDRARDEYGVRFIQSKVGQILEDNEHNLIINFEDKEGKLVQEKFDMVVLSVGLSHPHDAEKLSKIAGIDLNEFKFAETSEFEPFKTKADGIFVGGAFQGPKDIPETVAQASGAAAEVDAYLSESRFTEIEEEGIFPEIPVIGDPPRVGVFVCHCGVNIGGYVDVEAVSEYALTLPYVEFSICNLYTCSADTQVKMKELIDEHKLNRVVVASCTPRTHEPLFQSTIKEAGLNPYLFEMANIRDQNSWVHMQLPVEATDKAKELVRMAVFKASLLEPLHTQKIDIVKVGMVIGGGISGIKAALKIAEAGFDVYLIEKEKELGGQARFIFESAEGNDVQKYLNELLEELNNNKRIKVFKGSTIEMIDGFLGNFKTRLLDENEELVEIDHGVIIVATGADMYTPTEFLYGTNPNVITQRDFEKLMHESSGYLSGFNNVAMIQCVGSRNDDQPYCSRICCTEAVKNAIHLKNLNPDSEIFVFYRDLRTYGFKEKLYEEAREKGVIFINYDDDNPPEVFEVDGKLKLRVYDRVLLRTLELDFDKIILSAGIVARKEDNEDLARMLKVPLNAEGFFLEAHMKLRPVDFATDGIFLAGLAHSPKMIDESISQAYGAAARALTVLTRPYIVTSGVVAEVDEMKCDGCKLCINICPYKAIDLVEKRLFGGMKQVAEVNPALCKGCGLCAASCRSNSIDLKGFTNDEIIKAIDALVYDI